MINPAQPLRILVMLHVPLDRNFGGSRVQLELAEVWRSWGHEVEYFDLNRAFRDSTQNVIDSRPDRFGLLKALLAPFWRPSFASKAREFIRAEGDRFDVIDAHQGNLPFSKADLGYRGLLVVRSVGLYPLYVAFDHGVKPAQLTWRGWLARQLLQWRDRQEIRHCLTSFRHADLINLPNPAEAAYLAQTLGVGAKCRVFPFGLAPERRQALATIGAKDFSPLHLQSRLENPQLTFIGTWCVRKGSQDWRSLLLQLWATLPDLQVQFLGTRSPESVILRELALPNTKNLTIIPDYRSEDLPALLIETTVGAFPSYIEGFGFAILEKLAAGIPTVAYNIPGPQTMLTPVDPTLLTPIGDPEAMADKLLELLTFSLEDYQTLAHRCQTVAAQFCWQQIAQETMEAYQVAHAQLREIGKS
ncbi:glycosyltransferase family 4 protein [Spirulina sp. CCNP1310]|uniref:glycosyltransferase family 4 protein n=1 Tax=Spirulina sp. CCNP1310 TaxID=3110249 RepID=UPI002B1F4591|nr:glycosyltransferase family 4 protein [Spirulina sp. CCNP1310]MEA5418947.1 glycosyltransferase family 4 protein [Spirulina sp. CCNP1310]